MTGIQYGILAYALYLIYSGISNKRKLKQPNPIFPDEEVNVLFIKIDKTLKLCSTICIFLGIFMLIALLSNLSNLHIIKIYENYLWLTGMVILFIAFIFLSPMGNFGFMGSLPELKKYIIEHYEEQDYRKIDDWIDHPMTTKGLWFWKADTMQYHMRTYFLSLFGYPFTKIGLYIYYVSVFIFTLVLFI